MVWFICILDRKQYRENQRASLDSPLVVLILFQNYAFMQIFPVCNSAPLYRFLALSSLETTRSF